MDKSDLKKLKRFFEDSPRLLRPVTAGVLNSLAFESRRLYLKQIEQNMIIRNRKFVESSLQVQKARSGPIERQIALSGSVERPRFTGWEEQEKSTERKRPRVATTTARGGSKRGMIKPGYRLKTGAKFYRPEQFRGRSYHSSFTFMMRVLNSRGGSNVFLMTQNMATKRGRLNKGLYLLKNREILRLQSFKRGSRMKRMPWRTEAINKLKKINVHKIWADQITHYLNKYK